MFDTVVNMLMRRKSVCRYQRKPRDIDSGQKGKSDKKGSYLR